MADHTDRKLQTNLEPLRTVPARPGGRVPETVTAEDIAAVERAARDRAAAEGQLLPVTITLMLPPNHPWHSDPPAVVMVQDDQPSMVRWQVIAQRSHSPDDLHPTYIYAPQG